MQIAAIIDRSFPQERDWLFWNIVITHLLSVSFIFRLLFIYTAPTLQLADSGTEKSIDLARQKEALRYLSSKADRESCSSHRTGILLSKDDVDNFNTKYRLS